jgi:hypothetical protein
MIFASLGVGSLTISHQVKFNRRLNRLYEKRTGWLRTVLTKANPGPVPTLNKKQRERAIKRLQGIASDALARRMAKKQFERSVARQKIWLTKGRGTEQKLLRFRAWAKNKIDQESGKVYVFWHKKKCLYVGRTIGRGSRPSNHFRKRWFKGTTRIVVYMAPHKRDIPRLECLAVHRFLPSRNKVKAAKERWTPKCPLCALHRKIKTEMRAIFRFR